VKPDDEQSEKADDDADIKIFRDEEVGRDEGEQAALLVAKGNCAVEQEVLAALVTLNNMG